MCRHLAYVGPPTRLAALLLDAPHGLLHQSYAPSDMRGGGTVNADGFGAGWYPPVARRAVSAGAAPHGDPGDDPAAQVGAGPARYRSDRPLWADTGFAALAAVTPATGVLAAVRSATPGMPVTSTAAAPFAEGRWLFSHNGVVRGWPAAVAGLGCGAAGHGPADAGRPHRLRAAVGAGPPPSSGGRRPGGRPGRTSCAPSTARPPVPG